MFAYEIDRAGIFVTARTFVWEHWHDQKPGYLTITGSSVDATSTSQPDDAGRWRVGIPLRADEKPDATKHKLEFRDKCGDVEDSL